MSDIKLIAIDMDGTLLNSEGEPAQETIHTLQQAAQHGITVMLASARLSISMLEAYTRLGLHAPMISIDGAQIWERGDGAPWQQTPFSREIALEIAQLADEKGWALSASVGTNTYYRRLDDQPPGEFKPARFAVATNADTMPDAPLRVLTWDKAAIPYLQDYVQEHYADHCRTELFANPDGTLRSLGILAREVSKGAALRVVMDKLNLTPEQVMAIGDGPNDITMFDVAGTGIAMGNAIELIKRAADHIAPSNDEDGVGWAVRQFALEDG